MRNPLVISAFAALATSMTSADESAIGKTDVSPALRSYLMARVAEFDQIPPDRKTKLQKIASYIQKRRQADEPIRLIFICTHNSRRSQMSQVWAAAAARFYGIDRVENFSGGTEATAFNPRAVAAIQRAGVSVQTIDQSQNPRYAVRFTQADKPIECYSKVYDETPNPMDDFCAVMTCSQADSSCPVVSGSSLRVALPFEDPKRSDDQPDESAIYDARCEQICREMFYLFSQVEH